MSLYRARVLGERVLEVIGPLIVRGELAGSVRRRRSKVHDVDVVVIPSYPPLYGSTLFASGSYFPDAIANKIKEELGGEVVRSGPKILSMTVRDRQVDVYSASEADWGVQLLRWTGSKEHNVWLCRRARRMGLKLAVSRGLEKDGMVIASRTEEEIFGALGLPWIPPEERER